MIIVTKKILQLLAIIKLSGIDELTYQEVLFFQTRVIMRTLPVYKEAIQCQFRLKL